MSTAITEPKENRLSVIVDNVEVKNRIKELLGDRAPQFVSSVLSIGKSLGDVEPRSLISACVTAATLDLPINPNLGFAHIVPYRQGDGPKIAQFQMGYKGFVQLAMRTAQYRFINACVVMEGELVKYDKLTGELKLKEDLEPSDKIAGYASYFRMLNGFEHALYMTREQCETHGKKYSQSYRRGYGVWKDNFDAMALKTVIKLNLSKWGILSVQMEKALFEDQAIRRDLHAEAFYPDGNETIGGPTGLPTHTLTEGGSASPQGDAKPNGAAAEEKKTPRAPRKSAASTKPAEENESLTEVKRLLAKDGFEEPDLIKAAIQEKWCEPEVKDLSEIPEQKLKTIIEYWQEMVAEMDKLRAPAAE